MKCLCYPQIETSKLICYANQLTGFYMRAKLKQYSSSRLENGRMLSMFLSTNFIAKYGYFFYLNTGKHLFAMVSFLSKQEEYKFLYKIALKIFKIVFCLKVDSATKLFFVIKQPFDV